MQDQTVKIRDRRRRLPLGRLAAAVLCIAPAQALAGAWTLEAGTGQVVVGAAASMARAAFDGAGERNETTFDKATAGALIQYGLLDGVTLILEGEAGAARQGEAAFAPPALGAAGLGGRVRLHQADGLVVSAELVGRIARNYSSDGAAAGALDAFEAGSAEADAKLLAGQAFRIGERDAFIDAGAGYRHRAGEGLSDEGKLDLTFGMRVRPDILVLVQSFSTLSLDGSDDPADGTAYSKAQLSGVLDLDARWSLQAGGFTTIAGRNALAERGVVTAVWYRF